MFRNAGPVILLACALTLSACAAEPGANKEGANAEDDAPEVVRLGSADGHSPYQGELGWDDRVRGELDRRRPYHYWSFEGSAGSRVFVDAASRAGDDLLVLFYTRSEDGGWELREWNDDCYDGTLNACLELTLPEADEYLALVTTYDYIAWNARVPAEYHLTIFCRDGVGACEAGPQACGSRGLPECSDGQVCVWEDGSCGADDRPGTCEPQPAACTEEYDPVCGCDGETYSNGCHALAAGTSVSHEGECIDRAGDVGDTCGGILGEVCREGLVCDYSDSECGSDIQGTCVEDTEIFCTAEYDPVCGCDGVTYSNDCRRRAAYVGLAHDGEC
ncbi:MAG: Kazal-type serine protease inhibitor family protein [Polyangiales bacterium]